MPKMHGEGVWSAEATAEPSLDILTDYAHELVSLGGKTYTLEEAFDRCPVPREQMTQESINMRAAFVLNKAGVEIKAEHLDYFREVTEERGVDLNVTVRPPEVAPLVDEEKSAFTGFDYGLNEEYLRTAVREVGEEVEGIDTLLSPIDFAIQSQNIIDKSNVLNDKPDDSPDPDLAPDSIESLIIKTQELDQLPSDLNEQVFPIDTPPVLSQDIAVAVSNKTDTPILETATIIPIESGVDSIVPEPIKPEEESAVKDPPTEIIEIQVVANIEDQAPTVPLPSSPSAEAAKGSVLLQAEKLEAEPEQRLMLAELLPPEEVFEVPEDLSLTEQVILYAETSGVIDEIQLEIKTLAVEIDNEVQALVEMTIDPDFTTEEIEAVEQKLELLCATLLEYAGIEYDQEVLKRFVQTLVMQQSLPEVSSDSEKLSFDKGTHESKTFTLRSFMLAIQSRLIDFRSLGRYALVGQDV